MHICFLCNEYPPAVHGGVGVFVQATARELARRGIDVSVAGLYRSVLAGIELDHGVRVVRMRAPRIGGLTAVRNALTMRKCIAEAASSRPVDIFDGTELSFGWPIWGQEARRVIRLQGGHHFFSRTLGRKPKAARAWLERASFGRASAFCGVSKFVVDVTSQDLNLRGRPIAVIPNPVDVTAFRELEPERVDPLKIVFAGTVCQKKGVHRLLEALPAIRARVPGARLAIAGRDLIEPGIGSFIEHLRRSIPASCREAVEFLGPVAHTEMPNLMGSAAVCVFPSFMESQGIVFIEAMATGRPVIGPNTGPVPEIIEDGVSGLLCNPHDPQSIADRVIQCLTDRALTARLGAAGRSRAVDFFSVERMVDRNLEFYEQVLAGKAS